MITFNRSMSNRRQSTQLAICLYRQEGTIRLSPALEKALGGKGRKVNIIYDDKKNAWYIQRTNDIKGLPISGSSTINSAVAAEQMRKTKSIPRGQGFKFLVNDCKLDGQQAFELLLSKSFPLNKQGKSS
jgi:hypothetical protein